MLLIVFRGFLDIQFVVSILRFYNPMAALNKVPVINKVNISIVTIGLIIEFFLIFKRRGKMWRRKFVIPYMWFTGLSVVGVYISSALILIVGYYFPSFVSKKEVFDFVRNWNALIELSLFVVGFCFFILSYKSAFIPKYRRNLDNESTGFLDDFAK